MPKLKPNHIHPTDAEDIIITKQAQEDDTELPDNFWANAKTIEHFPKLQAIVGKRGKQKAPTKTPVSLRLSPEVADYFKSTGKGWQTRLNEVLLEYVRNHQ